MQCLAMVSIILISFNVLFMDCKREMSVRVQSLPNNTYNLGEGPHWEASTRALYFVDAFVGRVLQLNESSGHINEFEFQDLVTIVIPFKDQTNIVLVSLRNKVLKFDTKTRSREVIAEISPEFGGKERFNDGKVDALGRLWIGSVFDGPNGPVPQRGSLYKLDKNKFVKMSENFTLSNGMSWDLNNTQMYFNDSGDRKIYVFDYDLQKGLISNKRVLVDLQSNPDFKDNEFPDGMTTDKNDKLWIALYGGGRVVRMNRTNGEVETSIGFESPLTTSLAFGGPALDTMYVTSGVDGLSDQDKSRYPNAGKLFRVTSCDANFVGVHQPCFDPNS